MPSPAVGRKNGSRTDYLEGIVTAALREDPRRLRDPSWVEPVVRIGMAALAG